MGENPPVRLLVLSAAALAAVVLARAATAADWLTFGSDPGRSNAPAASTGITAANVSKLVRQQVPLDGVADSSAVYLRGATVNGAQHDTLFVTTSYGRTEAIDADSGNVLWEYVPPGIAGWDHTAQITTAAPALDPDRRSLYAVSPDGKVHKLSVADGSEIDTGGWPVAITLDPKHEKIGPALNVSESLVLAATGGYIGDIPPYQGHVVTIDRTSGRIINVFNTLCSNRRKLIEPTSCRQSGSAIWGRGGVVVEPGSHRLLVATGNSYWDGRTYWGDSVLELSPDAGKLLQAYTPTDSDRLQLEDLDLGSSSPAILTPHLAVQAGKDGKLKLLSLDRLNGKTTKAAPIRGGALQVLPAPRGRLVVTAPAVWHSGGRVWLYVSDYSATAGYVLVPGAKPRLKRVWETHAGGSSPVVAGGLLYSYDPLAGGLHVYLPKTGKLVATLPAGLGHWDSPIVADGRVALPEGDANQHRATSVLDIYRLPGRSS
jgi:outer membrane protein assembly factor BamB